MVLPDPDGPMTASVRFDLDACVEREVAQRMGYVGTKRGSLPRAISLAVRSTAALMMISTAPSPYTSSNAPRSNPR